MALTEAHCCRLLGVSAASTLEETRAAYRHIARRMHPDRAGGDAEAFKEITAAYNWLVARRSGKVAAGPRAARTARTRTTAERRARARRAWEQAKAREAQKAREAADRARVDAERAKAETEAAAERLRAQAARAKAARQRARAAKRKAREAERARVETRWDEEFTDAWEAWCKTAERYHAQREQQSADAAAGRSRAERSERAEAPGADEEAKPWTPPAADADAPAGGGEPSGGSIFGRLRQGLRRVARKASLDRVGQDVSLRLPVDLDLLLKGGTRTLGVTRSAACPSCAGSGDEHCVCRGAGRVKVRETVKVTVPPGARSGSKLRLEGKGTAGLDGAPDGDLFLLLEPEAIPGFRSEGLDLHGQVTLSRRLAGDGGTVAVELPRGRVKLKVPRSSRAGDTFRLRGQGLPSWGGAEQGDLFLSVVIR